MNIYEQIAEWLLSIYSGFDNWLYFNVLRMESGSNSLSTVSGTTVLNEYIDGSTENEIIFGISLVRLYSTEMSTDNIDIMSEIEALVTAIEDSETLPDFGEGYRVDSITIVQDIPSINIDQDNNICEYQIQASINYIEKA